MSASSARVTSSRIAEIPKPGSNDVFEKCRTFTRPSELQAAGLYMYFETFGDREGCGPGEVRRNGRKILMFGSNDYLDLIRHPEVMEAAASAALRYGSGCSGSRLLNGTLDIHVELEAELAKFVRKDSAIIFGTGFQANYATLSALTDKGDTLICDHNLHASLVEGALRSDARMVRFRHNDLDHFERCLENCKWNERVLVVSEGVFSMEGDIAELRGLTKIAKQTGARIFVDEAHGIGVLGENGAGAAEHLGVLDDVDLIMGTFSKSLASVGGFIAGEKTVIDFLKHTARAFVFSASLPAASVAAAAVALRIIQTEPERRAHLLRVANLLRGELKSRGFTLLDGETAIVPVVFNSDSDLCMLSKMLLEEGIYINPILRPAASQNLLRISCTAAHTEAHVDRLVSTIEKVVDRLGIEK
jgi:8-amino-7-oxononanoate synthase